VIDNGLNSVRHIHFVGIAGVGMAGIAEVLHHQGYTVSGSDEVDNALFQRLKKQGVQVFLGHDKRHVQGADVIVVSSAIGSQNVELMYARQKRIPVLPRALMLAELMRFRYGIAVAGTHGKTSTTSLVASLLSEAGYDPTFVIGGKLLSANSNAQLGHGKYFVAEADESDASFLHLNPMVSIVTNIDADHLENYDGSFERIKDTFIDFLHRLPFYGTAIMCIDDPGVQAIISKVSRPVLTYGFSEDADYRVCHYTQHGYIANFELHCPLGETLSLRLSLPGKHYVLNATAAVVLALMLKVPEHIVVESLEHFKGVARRFQVYGDYSVCGNKLTLVDDYGHHPQEIRCTLEAARAVWPDRRIVLLFQPHRFSRTRDFFDQFSQVLSTVDLLLLMDVYPAGEQAIVGADSHALSQSIRQRSSLDPIFVDEGHDLRTVLENCSKDGDVLLVMGAGSIGGVAMRLASGVSALKKIEDRVVG
jgi:UDP-N-acetylmuramate--alanine ligase